MILRDLQNKNILIWGMGKEGLAVQNFLEKRQLAKNLYTYNDGDNASSLSELLSKTEVIIRSPGVSIYKEEIVKAKEQGIRVTSSTDLFIGETRANRPNCTIIGVTGSKGKSTTSSLIYTALNACGENAVLGGNIGRPLIELLEEEHKFVVAELSSYQCSDLSVSPQIVLFTNLFPEHIDWHLTHDNYYRDKVHLIANQKKADAVFVNAKCDKLCRFCQEYNREFSYYNIENGFAEIDNILCQNGKPILRIEESRLEGYHNLSNMAGVLSVIEYLGLDIIKAVESFKTFDALPHRLQKIGKKAGVDFFNDSISTAPETAMAAIGSFDKNMGLILGGYDRAQDYQELAEFINAHPKVKAAATLFQTGNRVAENLKKYVKRDDFSLIEEADFATAVNKLWQELQKYDEAMLLLSPAAPSYGIFKSFEQRGDEFIRIYNEL